MKKQKLLEFCKAHGIVVPRDAGVEYINAAIARAALHETEPKVKDGKTCFGFWELENSVCVVCDFESKCFKASMGMSKDEYFKKIEDLENPRLRMRGKFKR